MAYLAVRMRWEGHFSRGEKVVFTSKILHFNLNIQIFESVIHGQLTLDKIIASSLFQGRFFTGISGYLPLCIASDFSFLRKTPSE
jgi:hypothetical protein